MKVRTAPVFVALALLGSACASDDDRSSSATAGPGPTPRRDPVVVEPDEAAGTGAPAGTEAPAATEAAAETETAAESDAPATTARADDAGPLGYADDTVPPPARDEVIDADVDAVSTFAMDVDTGSYTYAAESLRAGMIPDPTAVRPEEFVNSFEQDYRAPDDGTFELTIDGTTAPFLDPDARIVRVGIQGRVIDDEDRPDANLTFVIDISGSMADPGKLELVKTALVGLLESLRPTDRVAVVVYSDDTRVALASTKVRDRDAIAATIEALESEGSTNVQDGLDLGYAQARSTFEAERINRVVLLSDGVANVGATGPDAILGVIEDRAREGIDLVTVGFGMGEYNDSLMEQLADRGDGFYAYVDGEAEAQRLFTDDLTGTLQTIARDAKVQVTFNADAVATYRLIGFENRAVADDDFRDDTVDGGEVGAGHTVTALYEVNLREGADPSDWWARADVRWLDPETREPDEVSATVLGNDLADRLGDAPMRLQQDVYVAAFAEYLRDGTWRDTLSLSALTENVRSVASRLDDPALLELADLIDQRRHLG